MTRTVQESAQRVEIEWHKRSRKWDIFHRIGSRSIRLTVPIHADKCLEKNRLCRSMRRSEVTTSMKKVES